MTASVESEFRANWIRGRSFEGCLQTPSESESDNGSGLMCRCPKFLRCSAPLCPLDPDWRKRRHVKGDHVCRWLTEWVKDGAWARLQGVLDTKTLWALARVFSEINSIPDIAKAVNKARCTGSVIERGMRLHG